MAGVGNQRTSESPTDVQSQITDYLSKDGLNPQCADTEKLLYLWRLYQNSQTDLKLARELEEKLRQSQSEEMKEVENYVEHIRHLSDEREALIQELEGENEALKSEVEQFKANESDEIRKETSEMLSQQGLDEIAKATSSEQIAFLLVERARLLDELEAEQNNSQSGDKDSEELKKILERERDDFEEEMQQLRQQENRARSSLKHEHEEEIGALMDENAKLEDDLNSSKQKLKELEAEINRLTDDLENEHNLRQSEREERDEERRKEKEDREKERQKDKESLMESPRPQRAGLTRSASDVSLRRIIEEKTKIEGEIIPLRSKIRSMETEIGKKEDELKKMKNDMEKGLMQQQQLQLKNKNLRAEAEELEQQLDEAESSVEKLSTTNEELSTKLSTLQEEVKVLRSESQKASTLQDVVDIMKNDKQNLTDKMATLKNDLAEAEAEREELTNQNTLLTKKEDELTNHIDSLKQAIELANEEREKMCRDKDDLLASREEQEGQLRSLHEELETLKADKTSLSENTESMSKDNKELTNQIAQLQEEMQKNQLSHSQELAKLEIISSHMREQNQKLTGQMSDIQSELNDTRVSENTLLQTQKSLMTSNDDLEKKYKLEMDDITTKLQMTLSELTKTRTTLEHEQCEKTSLSDKLSFSETQIHELTKLRASLEQERKSKSDLESKIHETEMKLAERTMVADGFEGERKQRIELERKVFDYGNVEDDLTTARDRLDQERRMRNDLEAKVLDLEQILEDLRMDNENLQHTMGNKVKSLEARVRALQDDLFTAQDELQIAQEKYEQAAAELEALKVESRIQQETLSQLQMMPPAPAPIQVNTNGHNVHKSQDMIDGDNRTNDSSKDVSELETSLELSNAKLQETFGALQTSSNKVSQLQQDLRSSNQKLEQLQQDLRSSNQKLEQLERDFQHAEKSLENAETQLAETKKELAQVVSSRDEVESRMLELRQEVEAVTRERDGCKRETELAKTANQYGSEERQKHLDRIKTVEEISRQLELDNREMAKKLSETMAQCDTLKDELHTERQREKHSQNVRYIQQLEADLDVAREQNRQLREELHTHQTRVFKLEANGVGQSAKYESTITRREMELKEVKLYHKKELASLTEKLDIAAAEARDMRSQLREREQELLKQQSDTSRSRSTVDRLEAQLNTEVKLRTDYENRNQALDQEMTKVWSQVRTLMEKNANLENTKRSLEDELDRRSSSSRQAENVYAQTSASQEATMKSLYNRTETAELKVTELSLQPLITKAEKLQRELQDVSVKMHSTEQNLLQAESTKQDMQDKSDHIVSLRNQLEGEKLQRTLLDQTVAELKHQVAILKQRETKLVEENRSLQHSMIDLESQVEELQDRSDTAYDMHHQMSEVGKKTLLEQITRLQKEVKELQYELLSTNEKRGHAEKRYEDRKLRTKEKLLKAREFYSHEKTRMNDQMTRMDEDLRLTRATLRKELEWKEKMDINYKQLLQEKRNLITQMTEVEETVRDRTRSLSMLQVRTKFLEEETSRLQDHVDTLSQQKHSLDRLVKDLRLGKDRDVARAYPTDEHAGSFTRGTSGIGNSINSSWDQDHLSDAMLTMRSSSSHINGYLNRAYPGGVFNLYSGQDNESEKSFEGEQEYEA
ncbi:trichohyalin-like isoform X2 [Haliotis rufescens]|uniref:trichohyalin-like isoform X2 n=1 Tax=Haliotis rufescens TaxID=6454 RepID=UPI00201F0390|nr:trichohyalin-like isoform X2 [Haliotis rufescens]